LPSEQAAKVTPFAGGNEGLVRKSAAGDFSNGLERWGLEQLLFRGKGVL
jgi:hypothetical protein